MHQIRFRLGPRPRPRWRCSQRSSRPLAGFQRSYFLRKKEKRKGRKKEKDREKKERGKWERRREEEMKGEREEKGKGKEPPSK